MSLLGQGFVAQNMETLHLFCMISELKHYIYCNYQSESKKGKKSGSCTSAFNRGQQQQCRNSGDVAKMCLSCTHNGQKLLKVAS